VHPTRATTSPKVFISYSHDGPEHAAWVLNLANRLRRDGIDATLDQYEMSPADGWPIWMERQLREAEFVLVVCSPNYMQRAVHRDKSSISLGVVWESVLTEQLIYDANIRNAKFIPILPEGVDSKYIPIPLRYTTYYRLTDEQGYEDLYRRLTNQPFVQKPGLGKLQSLSLREGQKSIWQPSKPWNVPFERNPVFVGRQDILERLRADLLKKDKQALFGPGGIGKTQIAIEYAYRYQEAYQAVFWTFANSEQSINVGFAGIARLLGLPKQEATSESVRQWLDRNTGWLLVFDNADQPELLRPFLPQQLKGHIILTSRARIFHAVGIIEPLEVSVLSALEAREFLLKRTGRIVSEKSAEAEALIKELGYYPLVLEQAGAYMVENQSSFANYLANFRKRRLQSLEDVAPVGGYQDTIVTTWEVNFAEVQRFPPSADLLRLSAFLAPDMIPLELLERGAIELGDVLASRLAKAKDDPVILDEVLKPLSDYSLIRRNPGTRSYSIHPLVQQAVQTSMSKEMKREWAERVVRGVSAAFPDPSRFENWPDCERLISQGSVCAGLINIFQLEFEEAVSLLNRAAYYLQEQGKYWEAQPLYQMGLSIAEKVLGSTHPDITASLNNLAALNSAQGRYAEAAALYDRALKIRETALGPEHLSTADSLNNLGFVYHYQGKYTEAEQLYARALRIREKALGSENPSIAVSLNNLGMLCQKLGKFGEAEPLFRRALAIYEKTLGPEHPDTVTSLNNLALLYQQLGKNADADKLFRQARESRTALEVLASEQAVFLLGFVEELAGTTIEDLAGLVGLSQKEVGKIWAKLSEAGFGTTKHLPDSQHISVQVTPAGKRALSLLRLTDPSALQRFES